MKNPFLFIAAVFIAVTACKSKPDSKSIIGKWKPVALDVLDATREENQEVIDSTILEFREDGKFINFRDQEKDSLTGKYEYNAKDSSLTVNIPGTEIEVQHFKVKWSADTLIVKNKMGEIKLLRK